MAHRLLVDFKMSLFRRFHVVKLSVLLLFIFVDCHTVDSPQFNFSPPLSLIV